MTQGLDFAIFAIVVAVLGLAMAWWFSARKLIPYGVPVMLLALTGLLALTWFQLNKVGDSERVRFISIMEGMAKTYASETTFLGHEMLNQDTPADDPTYLKIIEAQKRWLKANRHINDVYTVRKMPGGQKYLMVDSETDYDHNDIIEGETESRTDIGEIYTPDDPAMMAALNGAGGFTKEATHDRWGSWYSYYCVLLKSNGEQDGILGVDVHSEEVLSQVARARVYTLSQFAVLFFALLAMTGSAGVSMLTKRNEEQKLQAGNISLEKARYENLVHSVEGVVWESIPDGLDYSYVSPAADMLLGFPQDDWTEQKDFWQQHLDPADAPWVIQQRQKNLLSRSPYQLEYRMLHKDGRSLLLRERGVPSRMGQHVVLRGVLQDISEQQERTQELERAHRQLVETSRRAGMAEVATGVLHNVGNVLNSVNVCSTLLTDELRKSNLPVLKKIADLLLQQQDLATFISQDQRGRAIPQFLAELYNRLALERERMEKEIVALSTNVEHMKEVVMMQQSYAKMGGRSEPLDVRELVEDAIQINQAGLARHRIELMRRFAEVPWIMAERNKVLQILVNLFRNAKHAITDAAKEERFIVVALSLSSQGMVEISIADNGIGISAENMNKLFSYGFTTKTGGHGFGLHSSVNTAREMQGDLQASSPGVGRGARFVLSLPVAPGSPSVTSIPAHLSTATTDITAEANSEATAPLTTTPQSLHQPATV